MIPIPNHNWLANVANTRTHNSKMKDILPMLINHKMFVLFLWISMLEICGAACYNSSQTPSQCILCWSNDQTMLSCSSSNSSVRQNNCFNYCCGLSYSESVPSNCKNNNNSSSGLSLATILIIVFFSIPVVICIIMLIHSCIVHRYQTPANAARAIRSQAAPSSVNLCDHNLQNQYPYHIDSKQSCSICLEDECTVITHCSHTYHIQCLSSWVKKKESCPMCVGRIFNPIAVYCTICLRSVRMGIMLSKMNEQQKQEWEQNCELRCQQCLKPPEQIDISLEEAEVEQYQQPKLKIQHSQTKVDLGPSSSISKMNQFNLT